MDSVTVAAAKYRRPWVNSQIQRDFHRHVDVIKARISSSLQHMRRTFVCSDAFLVE